MAHLVRTACTAEYMATPSATTPVERLAIGCVYAAVLIGGASRVDVLMQIVPQLAGLVVLIVALWLWKGVDASLRPAVWFVLAVVALIAIQLVPLPPSLWMTLPGRSLLADAATLSGFPQPWRPISISPDMTIAALLGFLPSAAIVFIWPQLSKHAKRGVMTHFVVLGLVSAALGVLQLAGGSESVFRFYAVTNSENAVGLFANRNHHALFMAAILPMLAHWAVLNRQNNGVAMRRYSAMFAALFLLCSIIVAGSRAGLFLGVLGVLYFSWIVPLSGSGAMDGAKSKAQPFKPKALFARFAFPLSALSITAVAAYLARATAIDRLAAGDVGTELRAKVIAPITIAIKDMFPIGTGFGTFDRAYRIYEPAALLKKTYLNHAHNDFLEVVLEGGAIALILCGVFLIFWAVRSWSIWFRWDADRKATKFARVGSLVTGAVMISSVGDYPLRTPAIAALFTIACLWMLDASSEQRAGDGSPDRFPR